MSKTRFMPFIGGPADGTWAVLPEEPNKVIRCYPDDYVIFVNIEQPAGYPALWAAVYKPKLSTFLLEDLHLAYKLSVRW